MKKRRTLLLTVLLLLALGVAGIMSKSAAVPAQAKTYSSKAKAKKEINKLTKQLKKANKSAANAKKEYSKYKNQSKKNSKGVFPILLAPVRNGSPLVVQYMKSYYYVMNPGKSSMLLNLYSGEVRRTGETRIINGMTCAVVKEVSDPAYAKSKKARKKYESCQLRCENLKSKIKRLKKGLTFKLKGGSRTAYIGIDKYLLSGGTYYNKIKWKSSNSSVASVSKKGVVKGKKVGKVTVTAKMSLSKKTSRFKVAVKKNPNLKMSQSVISLPVESYQTVSIKGKAKADNWSSNNSKIVSVDKRGLLHAKAEGVATVTAKLNGKVGHIKVNVYTPKVHFTERIVEYTENDIGIQKTYKFMSNISNISKLISIEQEYIRLDSIKEPAVGQMNKYAEGSITVTFLKGKYDSQGGQIVGLKISNPWEEMFEEDDEDDEIDPFYSNEFVVYDYTKVRIEDYTIDFVYKPELSLVPRDADSSALNLKRLDCPLDGRKYPSEEKIYSYSYYLENGRIESVEYDKNILECSYESGKSELNIEPLAEGETQLKIKEIGRDDIFVVPVSTRMPEVYYSDGKKMHVTDVNQISYDTEESFRFRLLGAGIREIKSYYYDFENMLKLCSECRVECGKDYQDGEFEVYLHWHQRTEICITTDGGYSFNVKIVFRPDLKLRDVQTGKKSADLECKYIPCAGQGKDDSFYEYTLSHGAISAIKYDYEYLSCDYESGGNSFRLTTLKAGETNLVISLKDVYGTYTIPIKINPIELRDSDGSLIVSSEPICLEYEKGRGYKFQLSGAGITRIGVYGSEWPSTLRIETGEKKGYKHGEFEILSYAPEPLYIGIQTDSGLYYNLYIEFEDDFSETPDDLVDETQYSEILTGIGWFANGMQQGRDFRMEGDGILEFDVVPRKIDPIHAFSIELQASNEQNEIYYFTSNTNMDAWTEGKSKNVGTVSGDFTEEWVDSKLIEGHRYHVTVERSGQDFSIQYYDSTAKKKYCGFTWSGGNMPEIINVHLMAQIGTFQVSGPKEALVETEKTK